MADILIRLNGIDDVAKKQNEKVERINVGSQAECQIYGKKGTFCLVRKGEDAIASIGYVCHIDGDSVQATLSQILSSFDESQIGDIKKKLVGQYVLLIKRNDRIYLLSDFMGVRNIFYSDNGLVFSSSFSKVEDLVQTNSIDLDTYKVREFLAMRNICYPAWIGGSTEHKRIKWLLPYEYITIDLSISSFRLGSIVYTIDNEKQQDCSLLSSELLSILRAIIGRKEFKNSLVAASLTGGRDSRLVAAIAVEEFSSIHFRAAVSSEKYTSLKDWEIADKLAKIQGIPLDVYRFQPGRDEERFRELTEGFTPLYNRSITPLIDSAGSYSLGFGGVFGTELFAPIPWISIDSYVKERITNAKKALIVEDSFWNHLRELIYDEFKRIKEHYQLSNDDDRDYIRLFTLINTARYSSFILAAFNRAGYQLEPYGNYSIFNLALRVSPTLWGNKRRLGGDALVHKTAMAKLNPRLARVMTYSSFRPMLPLSIASIPFYLNGFVIQVAYWLVEKFKNINKEPIRKDFPGGYYISDGWEKEFLGRTVTKYGLPIKYQV